MILSTNLTDDFNFINKIYTLGRTIKKAENNPENHRVIRFFGHSATIQNTLATISNSQKFHGNHPRHPGFVTMRFAQASTFILL